MTKSYRVYIFVRKNILKNLTFFLQTAQFCHFKYACTQPHAHPVRLREKEGLLCPSLSWCSLTRSKQRFFCSFPATLSIEVGVSGFLPASCFESSVESYCDRATWSVSAGVSARASIGEQQMDTHGGKLVASLKCLTTEKKISFHRYRSLCSALASC